MTKKTIFITGIILVIVAAVGGFYLVLQQTQTNTDLMRKDAEQAQKNAEKVRKNSQPKTETESTYTQSQLSSAEVEKLKKREGFGLV